MPPEVEAAIDKRSSMSGDRQSERLREVSDGRRHSEGRQLRRRRHRARRRHGFIAQQIIQQQGGVPGGAPAGRGSAAGAPAAAGAAGAGAGIPELMNPADVAKVLGVTEADVISTIEAGDLKAKKIGSAYRVTRAALDEFLKH